MNSAAVMLVLIVVGASWWMTDVVRGYALRQRILDQPGDRSLHDSPTPRGGGVAIACSFLAATSIAALARWISPWLAITLVGGGLPVTLIGWLDDRSGVRARWRALVHVSAAVWAVWGLSHLDQGSAGAGAAAAWIRPMLAVLGISWAVNLYNFMDGIDGLAAGEAVVVGLAGAAMLCARGETGIALVCVLLAGAAGGFLPWNWAPARIFMGDAGSGLLGYSFGVIVFASDATGGLPLVSWLILLGVFVFDASLTLGRRLVRGDRWYDAHRSHAYQRAVQSGASHSSVTGASLALAALLTPLAFLATLGTHWAWAASGVAIAVLAGAYLRVEQRLPFPGR